MGEEEYRAYDAINVSTLKRLRSRIPAEIHTEIKPGIAAEFGGMFHVKHLEPHLWGEGKSHHIRPDTYPSKDGPKKFTGQSQWCKDWLADHADLPHMGRTGDYSLETLERMSESIDAMPEAKRMLEWKAAKEVVIFGVDETTGLQMKGKLDRLSEDDDGRPVVPDLKTTDSPEDFERNAVKFGYHMQDSWYSELCRLNGLEVTFPFIVVGTFPPYAVRVGVLDPESKLRGAEENRRLLDLYARLKSEDRWPAYRVDDSGQRAGIETFRLKIWQP